MLATNPDGLDVLKGLIQIKEAQLRTGTEKLLEIGRGKSLAQACGIGAVEQANIVVAVIIATASNVGMARQSERDGRGRPLALRPRAPVIAHRHLLVFPRQPGIALFIGTIEADAFARIPVSPAGFD